MKPQIQILRSLGVTASLFVWSACSVPPQEVASRYVKFVPLKAFQGATIVVAPEEDLQLAGTTLFIAPGALKEDAIITLEPGEPAIVEPPNKSAGPVALWGPAGTAFAGEVEMTLPYGLPDEDSAENLYVDILESDGRRQTVEGPSLAVETQAHLVRFAVRGFSSFQPGVKAGVTGCPAGLGCPLPDAGTADAGIADAGTGVRCGNNQCKQGEYCCNQSCGICAPAGSFCNQQICG